ncbi:uncharacterized protein RSE6_13503 [Rhynchosporium secalis]|uniref:Uncharacterized protein n=1 Tax=Rhynchosporium secalis TaxID=38038 RepID=A0A1E1MTV5_RHYSE|nr:uncharacterized protein RSE6_13503 [Rhynchosporium secalis]
MQALSLISSISNNTDEMDLGSAARQRSCDRDAERHAEDFEREEYRLSAQEKYAKTLEREEAERVEAIKSDEEAVRRLQQQWKMAAIAREIEAMRLEERERRKQADLDRVAKEQQKLEILERKHVNRNEEIGPKS